MVERDRVATQAQRQPLLAQEAFVFGQRIVQLLGARQVLFLLFALGLLAGMANRVAAGVLGFEGAAKGHGADL